MRRDFGLPGRKKLSMVMAFGVIAMAGFALAEDSPLSSLQGYDLTFPAMGSTFSLSAYADSQGTVEEAFRAVRSEIDRLVMILSDYESDSELNRLHRQGSTATPVSEELFAVLEASERWYHRTQGAFDASLGNLTRLWRNARKRSEIPDASQIETGLRHSGWNSLQLNRSNRTVTLLDPEVRIDLGGIAAGYIVDRAFQILVEHGLSCSLVNDGGDIRCGDPPPGRQGWRIEVASIRSASANRVDGKPSPPSSNLAPLPLRRIYLKNAAITTSGDLWQYSVIDGQRRSHILDPKTGYGVLGPSVVAVIAPTCLDADAAATSVSVLGVERGMAMIGELPHFAALFASQSSESEPIDQRVTPNFPSDISDH